MKFGTWLGLAALLCAAGCSSSGKKTANQGDSKALAEALSSGVAFNKGKKLSGVIPDATADNVMVSQNDPPLTLSPGGGDEIMSLDADNPDEASDPVVAMLVQFEDSKDHIEVPVDASGDGGVADGGSGTQHYEVTFSLDDGICKNFCKGEFTVVMIQALKLKKGGVSAHVMRDFQLDCRKKGAEPCEADKKDAGASSNGGKSGSSGSAGTSSGGSGTVTGIGQLNGALLTFSKAGCTCAGQTGKNTCTKGGLDATAIDCVKTTLTDNAAMTGVNGWAACAAQQLKPLTTTCMGCGAGACDPSVAASAGDSCKALPADVQTAVNGCKLDVGPGSSDASMP